jgi:Trk-type K+ transport system membrane component
MNAERLLFLAFSATSNVGLPTTPSTSQRDGLYTLSAMMLAGRLAPLVPVVDGRPRRR